MSRQIALNLGFWIQLRIFVAIWIWIWDGLSIHMGLTHIQASPRLEETGGGGDSASLKLLTKAKLNANPIKVGRRIHD